MNRGGPVTCCVKLPEILETVYFSTNDAGREIMTNIMSKNIQEIIDKLQSANIVHVDFSDVRFMDTAGIRVISEATQQKESVTFWNVPNNVRTVIRRTGHDGAIKFKKGDIPCIPDV